MPERPKGDPVVKTLFAHSNNVCAFSDDRVACEEKLTDPRWPAVNAIICHIRGLHPGSARYDAAMADAERNHYDNLILLCPNHSRLIDDLEPDDYPPKALREMKERYERHASSASWRPTEADIAKFAKSAVILTESIQIARRYEATESASFPGYGGGYGTGAYGEGPYGGSSHGEPS